eukprot:7084164-Heterocapsa_arctica.AAC.1
MEVSLQRADIVDDSGLEHLGEVVAPMLASSSCVGEHVPVGISDALRRRGGLAGECAHDAVELLRVPGSRCGGGSCGFL